MDNFKLTKKGERTDRAQRRCNRPSDTEKMLNLAHQKNAIRRLLSYLSE